MNILIVYAHPEKSSFNYALKEKAIETLQEAGHEIKLFDLYASWNDFTDIKSEQDKLSWSDTIIFQFPLWWFGVPAILKDWLDKILTPGFAYEKEKWFEKGLLQPKRALLSTTTQSPLTAYQPDGNHGDIMLFLHPLHHTLRFVGITPLEPFIAYGVIDVSDEERKKYLADYKKHLLKEIQSTNN
jgi:NAD(P)H dehydrogenase (quinone)